MQRQAPDRGHDLRSVHERDAFLWRQLQRSEAALLERVRARHPHPIDEGLTLTHEHERGVRERCEVSRRTDAAVFGDDRQYALVQEIEEQMDRAGADAGAACGERVRT